MSVVDVVVYHRDDLGDVLETFTDGDIFAGPIFRDAENELGAVGPFMLRRDHPDAAAFQVGRYVKININGTTRFAGFLDEGYTTVIGEQEEASEVIVRGGPGPIAVLRHMRLLDDWHAPIPPASDFRGTGPNIDGKWRWINEPYGAILTRIIEEGQNQPGTPLAGTSIDFDRDDDTNAVAWPIFTGEVEMDIGIDGLSAYSVLVSSGQLYVRPDPDLLIHAYSTSDYGTDRTSTTFATGKVRFVKGVNVLSGLDREAGDSSGIRNAAGRGAPVGSLPSVGSGGRGSSPAGSLSGSTGGGGRGGPAGTVGGTSVGPRRDTQATHALVEGKDRVYRQVVSPLYTTGVGRWTRVPYQETNDTTLLDAGGAEALNRAEMTRESMTLEILAGSDEAAGYYTPYEHFTIGDLVTVHTGTGADDFNQQTARVTGIVCALRDTSDDVDNDAVMKSLTWIIELNGGPTRGAMGSGAGSIDCCSCNLGTVVPSQEDPGTPTDPPAYFGEMYLGGFWDPVNDAALINGNTAIAFMDQARSAMLAYVEGTAVFFTGNMSDGAFIPDGRCFPGDSPGDGRLPESGMIDLANAPQDTEDAYRVYARVPCSEWVEPEAPV